MRLFVNDGTVCYRLKWQGIVEPTAAHIHEGEAEVAGDIVVTLFEGAPVDASRKSDCIGGVDSGLLRDIQRHPRKYYVNVHNEEFPAGAIRGQLLNT